MALTAIAAPRITEFWRNVVTGAETSCWRWKGYTEDGYGLFYWDGRMVGAHELALTFTTGEVRAPNLDTCHRCNNPICCNPSHLRFDTRAGNVADMLAAGRGRRGRFTDQQVRTMRERYAHGAAQQRLADDYEITNGLVSQIVRGLRYRNAPGPITTKRERYNRGQ
ncbi:hypothetical protein [Microbacterium oleivorans]|uniref:HNH nuclease domain-containing protein n=1 Tax=Microbacterium oleivorans TaxID=273677 RepID=A0A4R5YGQ9_9MICO|nr:hypothetical protein [Microbacterium oleivorans]TDL44056.1 hypothetical protein E2R54_12885 [Microbacterium oleivorans]